MLIISENNILSAGTALSGDKTARKTGQYPRMLSMFLPAGVG